MKIKTKISLNFIIAFLAVSALIGLAVGLYSTSTIKSQVESYLFASGLARVEHITTFIQDQQNTGQILAAASVYRDFLKSVGKKDSVVLKDKVKKRLDRTAAIDPNIFEVMVLDKEGKILVSTNGLNENTSEADDPFFLNAKEKVYFKDIYFSSSTNNFTYAVSAPIKDEVTGELLGVSVVRYLPNGLYSIVSAEGSIESTEESFLLNSEKVFITPSLFLGNSVILKEKVSTKNADACFDPQEISQLQKGGYKGLKDFLGDKAFVLANDYRNVPIIGVHFYMPLTGWCMISKIDQSTAFSSVNRSAWVFFGILLISALLFLLISSRLSKKITQPLVDLKDDVEKIFSKELHDSGAPNLDKKKNEIAALADTFDLMYRAVRASRADIDKKVEAQTEEIKKSASYITEQRQAILNVLEDVEQEKDKIDTILHSIGDAIFVTDSNKNIILVNEVTEKMSEYKKEEMVGIPYTETLKFVFEADGNINDHFVSDALSTGKVQEMTNHTLLITKSGKKVSVSDSAAPLIGKDGKILGCVVVFRDSSREREVDRAKTEFVSLAAHQLKTPIGAINWDLEMLLAGDYGELTEKQAQAVKEAYGLSRRMTDLVSSFLNISRIELGTIVIDPKPTDFPAVCEDVLSELKEKIEKKGHTIIKNYQGQKVEALADPGVLHIIFQNLLSNAVKYTQNKGRITISIKNENEKVKIAVANNGAPIPEQDRSKIFNKLFRASNAQSMDTDGNGLGLYLLKSAVEAAGGTIDFESGDGKDTVFNVEFPLPGMKKKEGGKKLD